MKNWEYTKNVCKFCNNYKVRTVVYQRGKFHHRRSKEFCMHCTGDLEGSDLQIYSTYLMNRFPERVKILSECECDTKRKERHHPDYKKPYVVELLCCSCHSKAHVSMKNYQPTESHAKCRRTVGHPQESTLNRYLKYLRTRELSRKS